MKKIISFLILVLFGFSLTQGSKRDVPIGHSSLEIPFDELLKGIDYDKVEEDSGFLIVYKNGVKLFSLSDKNGLKDRVVRSIDVFSSNLILMNGIRVGMPMQQLIRMFPDAKLYFDSDEHVSEFLLSPTLQKNDQKGDPDICFLIYVHSKNGSLLESGKEGDYPMTRFRTDGVVDFISIFKWK